jgi:AcrR family transcriptional regulator
MQREPVKTQSRAEPVRATGRARLADGRIRDACVRLFAQKGFQGTGIREIAAEAGVTTAALYHYVDTKEELLLDIMYGVLDPLTSAARRIVSEVDRPEARLSALVEHHVWFHAINQLATVVTDTEIRSLGSEERAEVVARRNVYEAIWRSVVADGAAEGTFRVDDPRVAAIALLQMSTGVAHWYRPTGPLTLTRLSRSYADLALSTVRATRDGVPVRADALELPSPTRWLAART